jgi:hypothetical protein
VSSPEASPEMVIGEPVEEPTESPEVDISSSAPRRSGGYVERLAN